MGFVQKYSDPSSIPSRGPFPKRYGLLSTDPLSVGDTAAGVESGE